MSRALPLLAVALVAACPQLDDVRTSDGGGAVDDVGDDVRDDDVRDDDVRDDDVRDDDGAPDAPACTRDGAIAGCVDEGGGDFACTIEHDGRTRAFDVHVPASYAERPASGAPVVFAFHGLRTNAALQRHISRMNAASDDAGYVVVYPEGTGPATEQAWNAGLCCADAAQDDVDDVGFTLAVLAHLRAALCLDDARVYATGLSNGGHMAYRLACEAADVFAAVAPVAGVTALASCAPSRPVPVLHFHGTDDAIVPYALGIAGVGAEGTVAAWAERNGCSDDSVVTYEHGEVTCRAFTGCAAGSAAELCTVDGGGHTWPGGADVVVLGHTTQDISATEYMGAFFAAHPMP